MRFPILASSVDWKCMLCILRKGSLSFVGFIYDTEGGEGPFAHPRQMLRPLCYKCAH